MISGRASTEIVSIKEDIETTKKNWSEIKNVTEMMNTLDRIYNRFR